MMHFIEIYKEKFFQREPEELPPKSISSLQIKFTGKRLDKKLKPTLFIDFECKICIKISKQFKKFDIPDNIKIKPLTDVTKDGYHHLKSLAESKTTMIFVEPRVNKNSHHSPDFLYSIKGRAVLRLFGYMPIPFCFLAAFEGVPGIPLLADLFYSCFSKIRKYL